ncbi:hypothetical protein P389DRAFT_201465 [Cystobasidium minutum MCA 4210]|uniref:uncharacterized protein n=1 Tax=Cystobasidium minutum MCA 4210 TaxID=1397322 RepID=UPI0034CDFAE5|eukprot:jgi/Rhomi1/201465/MIX2294_2_15
MAVETEDSNTSWNLSFDDEFDNSSDTFDLPTPSHESKRFFIAGSHDGYKSSPSHVKSEETELDNHETNIGSQAFVALSSQTDSVRIATFDRPQLYQSSTPASTPSKLQTKLSNSLHRQAKSVAYSSSQSQKWQGRPIDTTTSPRKISPHNSPLMSSFARAQEHHEQLTAGTLSGLLLRFLRTKSVSSLFIRLATFIIFLLVVTLLLNRNAVSNSSLPSSPIILGTLDDDANLLAARALLQSHESQKTGDNLWNEEPESDEFYRVESSFQEEKRKAHVRAAKARLRNAKLRQEQEPIVADDAEKYEAVTRNEAPAGVERQRAFHKAGASEQKDDVPAVEESREESSESVEPGEKSQPFSGSEEPLLKEEEQSVSLLDQNAQQVREAEQLLSQESRQVQQAGEQPDKQQAPVLWRKGGVIDDISALVEDEDIVEDDAADKGRSAVIERLEVARELARLEFEELQAEQKPAVQMPMPPAREEIEDEFLQVETDEKEVYKPDMQK